MNPVQFPEANQTWTKPEGMTDEQCESLPVHRTEHGQLLSCWNVSEGEMAKLQRTRRVWLWVWSGEHPPVSLNVDSPFAEEATAEGPCRTCGEIKPVSALLLCEACTKAVELWVVEIGLDEAIVEVRTLAQQGHRGDKLRPQ